LRTCRKARAGVNGWAASDATLIGKRPQAVPGYFSSLWANDKFDADVLRGFTVGAGQCFVNPSYAEDANNDGYEIVDFSLRYGLEAVNPLLRAWSRRSTSRICSTGPITRAAPMGIANMAQSGNSSAGSARFAETLSLRPMRIPPLGPRNRSDLATFPQRRRDFCSKRTAVDNPKAEPSRSLASGGEWLKRMARGRHGAEDFAVLVFHA
jgi:hypothetical protein